MGPVMICTSAFGADHVTRQGQGALIEHIRRAGADGIELREELLSHHDQPLDELRRRLADSALRVAYSSAIPLFDRHGATDGEALGRSLARAEALGATFIKFALGDWPAHDEPADNALQMLLARFERTPLAITIENDQTSRGGDPQSHLQLHRRLWQLAPDSPRVGGPRALSTTFDLGNGYWNGHPTADGINALAARIGYMHCKHACNDGEGWHACAPDDATLETWSRLWRSLPADLPRALEFPVPPDDPAALRRQVDRLRHLPLKELC
ncbi:xylose isomerase-like TIM barrel protein [Kushneria sinocarnis]|uniref:Xylose isomerase-like TIM barrel protein n=1 Tax=Kushneria sinocarnis TaxID=595502 RepID=A0A420WVU2_9GAMM|nr:TIM barrel protein [Kushneria sinocarnis]RKR02652.1 xylose isomerase-like TIM barrel protein [Kushneria sinocarnis]